MTDRTPQLIVAASAGGVLNTGTPLPMLADWLDGDGDLFPVTVGRWEVVIPATATDYPSCEPCRGWQIAGASWPRPCREHYEGEPHGAVVEHGEVTGPSHHAFECAFDAPLTTDEDGEWGVTYCHPDAAPDGFHTPWTPLGVLDVPQPCERPITMAFVGAPEVPADWWAPTENAE